MDKVEPESRKEKEVLAKLFVLSDYEPGFATAAIASGV